MLKKMNRWIKWIIKSAKLYKNQELVDKALNSEKEIEEVIDEYYSKDESQKIKELRNELEDKQEDEKLEEYYNNKYSKVPILYSGRKVPDSNDRIDIDVRAFIQPHNNQLDKVLEEIDLEGKSDDEKALECLKWVIDNITYVSDSSKGPSEFWQFVHETIYYKTGDCVAEYEEIYTKEGLKKAEELEEGDMVLSYDFDKNKFVYKPIVNKWNKGKLPIKRVNLRNGRGVDVTDEHKFLVRNNQKRSEYEEKELKEIDLTRWWKRKIPIAKEIPYEVEDIAWLNEDLCLVIGHFLAEGWIGKSHVCSSGYETIDKIIPILEKNDISFSEYKNNNGVPCIRFLKSNFKNKLKTLKGKETLSFSGHLTKDLKKLPKNKLEKILEGYFIGDGHYSKGRDVELTNYSTSSKELAEDLCEISLKIGKPLHFWKQENHQGLGKRPIYRLRYNPNSYFIKDYGYENLSEVSISNIEDVGEVQTYDWEVEGTHNFVFRNGTIAHNCEDQSILLANLMQAAGIESWKIRLTAGYVKGGGHCYVTYYCKEENKWVILDATYYPNRLPVKNRKNYKEEENYNDSWFSWNYKYSFAGDVRDIDKFKDVKSRSQNGTNNS